MLESIKNKVNNYLELKENTKILLQAFVKVKEYDLEDRWDLFIDSGLGYYIKKIPVFKSFDVSYFVDSFYEGKIFTCEEIIDIIYENGLDTADLSEEYSDKFPEDEYFEEYDQIDNFIESKINSFKEEILESFIYGFEIY